MAKSPKKPRRGGEHDPAVNTAAGAPSKGVSVDPAVNTAAGAQNSFVESEADLVVAVRGCCSSCTAVEISVGVVVVLSNATGTASRGLCHH